MGLARALSVLMATLALLAAGCGEHQVNAVPQPADPAIAHASLRSCLDAWKKGDAPESLKNREPSIIFTDADWNAGTKLLDYQVEDKDKPKGGDLYIQVNLTVAKQGKTGKSRAVYAIATHPRIVIIRY